MLFTLAYSGLPLRLKCKLYKLIELNFTLPLCIEQKALRN